MLGIWKSCFANVGIKGKMVVIVYGAFFAHIASIDGCGWPSKSIPVNLNDVWTFIAVIAALLPIPALCFF